MKTIFFKLLPIFFFFVFYNTHAFELSVTGKSLESALFFEYNRSENFSGDISITGDMEFSYIYLLRSGLSFGMADNLSILKSFMSASVSPFTKIPLIFSLSWIYNGLFNYKAHSHTFLPLVSYNIKFVTFYLGINLRITSFFKDTVQFESILTYLIFFNVIDKNRLHIGISLGNFDDFNARNALSFSFGVNGDIKINDNWKIINKIELFQSGIDGLSNIFYGVLLKTGARYSW